jgi:ubiquinone/menaquinone biosynthesis C-methylase UbiE
VKPIVWVTYTTLYREGGQRFQQVALTLAASLRAQGATVLCHATESKAAFRNTIREFCNSGTTLRELHFVGHSGMYGLMFGTRQWPEQLSPHEWRNLHIPFAPDGEAIFHACRTARWFAPFFADTFGVPASGYFWYTAFSTQRTHFARASQRYPTTSPLFVFGCPGKKSHGLSGALVKHLGFTPAEPLQRYLPSKTDKVRSYDPVAELYNRTFQHIAVREDEWRWIDRKMSMMAARPRVVDWGCGNGSLLEILAPRIATGLGIDASSKMITHAIDKCKGLPNLSFRTLGAPQLQLEDRSQDLVVCLLSFRYLDWDPVTSEVRRILKPGGRFWVVDMVAKAPSYRDYPYIFRDKLRQSIARRTNVEFDRALRAMVNDSAWKSMLQYNPIRAEHEYRWYLQSRFPGGTFEVINRGLHSRILAFDSGPL